MAVEHILLGFVAGKPLNRTGPEIEAMVAAETALREWMIGAIKERHQPAALFEALLSLYLDLSLGGRGGEETAATLRRAADAVPRMVEAKRQAQSASAGSA